MSTELPLIEEDDEIICVITKKKRTFVKPESISEFKEALAAIVITNLGKIVDAKSGNTNLHTFGIVEGKVPEDIYDLWATLLTKNQEIDLQVFFGTLERVAERIGDPNAIDTLLAPLQAILAGIAQYRSAVNGAMMIERILHNTKGTTDKEFNDKMDRLLNSIPETKYDN
jgi:hypothetical protein